MIQHFLQVMQIELPAANDSGSVVGNFFIDDGISCYNRYWFLFYGGNNEGTDGFY